MPIRPGAFCNSRPGQDHATLVRGLLPRNERYHAATIGDIDDRSARRIPGTKLAYDEYNWGSAKGTLAETLMTADGLGLFGQQGVDLASYWGLSDPSSDSTAFAFLMFRTTMGRARSLETLRSK